MIHYSEIKKASLCLRSSSRKLVALKRTRFTFAFTWVGLFLVFAETSFAQTSAISFTDISAASGITVPHVSTPEKRYIVESMSGGAAVFDCDGDGFLDVATVNGSSVDRYKKGGDPMITVYRQVNGEKTRIPTFENITQSAGLTRKGWGMAVTAVDYDNDGVLDLLVTGFDGNALYHVQLAQSTSEIDWRSIDLRVFSADKKSGVRGLFASPDIAPQTIELVSERDGYRLKKDPSKGAINWQITSSQKGK